LPQDQSTDRRRHAPFEIAVLYTVKEPEAQRSPAAVHGHALDTKASFPTGSRDYRAKKSYDITTNSVTISTIQSAKGLDYACVFLLGLDAPKIAEWPVEVANNLTYVAITRAREHLYIPYLNKSVVLDSLLTSR
jgi:ATP-dependent exoDNAse (exonuclease V) beta subunit